MKKDLKLAIYMDEDSAKIFEFEFKPMFLTTINIGSIQLDHQQVLPKVGKEPKSKVQQMFDSFSKNLGEIILNYDLILMFGPSINKTDVLAVLQQDKRFCDIKFQIQNTTILNEIQQIAVINTIFL